MKNCSKVYIFRQMKWNSKIGLFFLCLTVLVSCKPEEEYPIIPAIEFNSFVPDGDEGKLTINFTDGDGDIGLKESDIRPPFDTSSVYFNNCFIDYEEKVNGQWQAGLDQLGNPVQFKYRIPYVTPEGQNKALKGKIDVNITPFYYNPLSANSDTIRFRIKIVDRELHESNEVISDEIIR
jgi:hypothetical protein